MSISFKILRWVLKGVFLKIDEVEKILHGENSLNHCLHAIIVFDPARIMVGMTKSLANKAAGTAVVVLGSSGFG